MKSKKQFKSNEETWIPIVPGARAQMKLFVLPLSWLGSFACTWREIVLY